MTLAVGVTRPVQLDRLREHPENPRTIRRDRLDQLKANLTADPAMLHARPLIALPDGTVIAGNMRLRAARELGWAEIPVHAVDLVEQLRQAQPADVIREPRTRRNDQHPTMKPVRLLERLIRNSSARGDLVLDPFAGSGATLIAADKLGRRAALVELDPGYCDVIRDRWEAWVAR